jgi:hypothetical protein
MPEGFCGPCSICGAVATGRWPHREGAPCPMAADAHEREQARRDVANEAYVAMLEAQRMSHLRAGINAEEVPDLMRRIVDEIASRSEGEET